MVFSPDNLKLVGASTGTSSKEAAKQSYIAPVPPSSKGFNPDNFKLAALAIEPEKAWSDKFFDGMMASITTFNYQMGSGVRGMAQLVTPSDSFVGKQLKEINTREYKAAQQAHKDYPYAAAAGSAIGMAGDVAYKSTLLGAAGRAAAAAPKVAGALAPLVQNYPRLATILGQAGQGAAYGASQYADTTGDRLKHVAIGGGIGGAGEGAFQAGKAGLKAAANKITPISEQVLAKAKGTLGQVINSPSVQWTEQLLSKVPILGTKSALRLQRKELEKLTISLAEKAKVAPASKLATLAPTEPGLAAQYHIKQTAAGLKDKATALYAKFEHAAGKSTTNMPIPKAQEAAQRLLKQQEVFPLPGADEIQKVATTISSKGALHPGLIQNANKFLSTAYEATAKTSPTAAREILKIRDALRVDTASFAKSQGGELAGLYKMASDYSAKIHMPFKTNPLVSKVLNNEIEPDKIIPMILKPNQPQFVKSMLAPMSQEARGNFRNSVLTQLHEGAIKNGEFNAAKYTNDVQKVMNTMKGTLNAKQYAELKGVHKLFEHTSETQKYAAKTSIEPWYAISTAGAAAGALYASPFWGSVAIGGVKALSMLLTKPSLSKYLVDLAHASSKPAEAAVRSKIFKLLTKSLSNGAGQEAVNNDKIDYIIK